MKSFKAIGLDLGETLIYYEGTPLNWASLYPDALAAVAQACDYSPTEAQVAAAIEILKKHNTRLVPRTQEVTSDQILGPILTGWNLPTAPFIAPATKGFFGFFQRRVRCYNDTVAFLKSLRERGLPIGILTDVPYGMPREFVEADIASAGIEGLCDVLLTSVEVGLRKPDPLGFKMLAARLGAAPHEMLFVGNEPKDITGANAAGVYSVLINRKRHDAQMIAESRAPDYGQNLAIATLSDLLQTQ